MTSSIQSNLLSGCLKVDFNISIMAQIGKAIRNIPNRTTIHSIPPGIDNKKYIGFHLYIKKNHKDKKRTKMQEIKKD